MARPPLQGATLRTGVWVRRIRCCWYRSFPSTEGPAGNLPGLWAPDRRALKPCAHTVSIQRIRNTQPHHSHPSPRTPSAPHWAASRAELRLLTRRLLPALHHRREICRRFASSGSEATAGSGATAAFLMMMMSMIRQVHSRGLTCPTTGGARCPFTVADTVTVR